MACGAGRRGRAGLAAAGAARRSSPGPTCGGWTGYRPGAPWLREVQRAGDGAGARVQRGGGHRVHRAFAARLHPPARPGRRDRRRLDGPAPPTSPTDLVDPRVTGDPPAQRGQARPPSTPAWRTRVHDIVVMVDADTVFEPDALRRLVQPLAHPAVGAVSGNTKVANRRGLLGRWQHLEYVIGFNLDRRMFEVLECMPTVPGAIGAFRRDALLGVGGVSDDTLAEDTDLTMAIWRAGWRVVYEETAIAWTEVPAPLRQLWRQRYRWCYGTLQAMWKHRQRRRWSSARPALRPPRADLPDALPGRAAAVRAGRRRLRPLRRCSSSTPRRSLGVWLGFPAVQMVTRRVRAAARPGTVRVAVGAAAPAVRLPAADVPGGHPVRGHRAARHPAEVAPHAAHRNGRAVLLEMPSGETPQEIRSTSRNSSGACRRSDPGVRWDGRSGRRREGNWRAAARVGPGT